MTDDDRKKAEKRAHVAGVKATGEASGPLTSISPQPPAGVNTTATEVIEQPLEAEPDVSGMVDGDVVDSGLEHAELTVEEAREAAAAVERVRRAKMAEIMKLQAELAEMNKDE